MRTFLVLGILSFCFSFCFSTDPKCFEGTVLCGDRCLRESTGEAECVNGVCQVKDVSELSEEMQRMLSMNLTTMESIYEEDCWTIGNACGDTFCDPDFEECESGVCNSWDLSCGNETCAVGQVCKIFDVIECTSYSDLCGATEDDICDDPAIYAYQVGIESQTTDRRDLCSIYCSNENGANDNTMSSAVKATVFGAVVVAASIAMVLL
jgi:hypothetical protein